MTHICIGNLTIIAGRRQAIIWTNSGILLIGPWGTNFSKILIGIETFSFKKMHLKMSSAKWRPFCLGLNVLNIWPGSLGSVCPVISNNAYHSTVSCGNYVKHNVVWWQIVNTEKLTNIPCTELEAHWYFYYYCIQVILPCKVVVIISGRLETCYIWQELYCFVLNWRLFTLTKCFRPWVGLHTSLGPYCYIILR